MSAPELPEAAVEAAWKERWDGTNTSKKELRRMLEAAVPILHRAWLEGLIAKAEAKKDALLKAHSEPEFTKIFWGVSGDSLDLCRQALTIDWLRAELEGGAGE